MKQGKRSEQHCSIEQWMGTLCSDGDIVSALSIREGKHFIGAHRWLAVSLRDRQGWREQEGLLFQEEWWKGASGQRKFEQKTD